MNTKKITFGKYKGLYTYGMILDVDKQYIYFLLNNDCIHDEAVRHQLCMKLEQDMVYKNTFKSYAELVEMYKEPFYTGEEDYESLTDEAKLEWETYLNQFPIEIRVEKNDRRFPPPFNRVKDESFIPKPRPIIDDMRSRYDLGNSFFPDEPDYSRDDTPFEFDPEWESKVYDVDDNGKDTTLYDECWVNSPNIVETETNYKSTEEWVRNRQNEPDFDAVEYISQLKIDFESRPKSKKIKKTVKQLVIEAKQKNSVLSLK